jgi:uncharacterized protein (AIM24 family)
LFEGTGNVVSESANLFWDNTNGRLGIGTSSPSASVHSAGSVNGSFSSLFQNTLIGSQASTAINLANNLATSGGIATFSSNNNTAYLRNNIVLASYPTASNVILATSFDMVSGGTGSIQLATGGYGGNPTKMTLFGSTGNVLIQSGGTHTDAGFKLDVNGTARVTMGASAEFRLGTSSGLPAMLYSGGGYMMRWKNDASELYLQGTSFMVMRNNTQEFVMQPNSTYLSSGTFAVNTSTIIASAILQADSTTKGFLPPRMTTTQKNAIASPAEGLQVWDTTLKLMSVYNGTTWITL